MVGERDLQQVVESDHRITTVMVCPSPRPGFRGSGTTRSDGASQLESERRVGALRTIIRRQQGSLLPLTARNAGDHDIVVGH